MIEVSHKVMSVIAAVLMFAGALPQSVQAADFKGKVVTVIDGDTLMILNGQTPQKVVLYAIDCPEIGQDAGTTAKEFTAGRVLKKEVTVKDHGRDNYGRTIGEVILDDGTNLNKELVTSGLAWWTKKFAPEATDYRDLERSARTEKKGLWVAVEPVPPWIYRNGKRTRNVQAVIKTK
ncbi:MAG: thermonuclease family protein [Candidatus Obscuribacterales bacterium]